jgi:hypothetical protein
MHFVGKMSLFNREVRYQNHSGSGAAGSGSEMIYSGSDSVSGSGKKFRIRPDPDPYPDPDPQHCQGQCCESGMFIPDLDFYPSRIPDQKISNKREG